MPSIPNARTPDAPDYHLFSAEAEWESPIRTTARVAELFLWLAGPVLAPSTDANKNEDAIARVEAELVRQLTEKGLRDDEYVIELPDAGMVLRWSLEAYEATVVTALRVEAWPSRHHEPWDPVLRGVVINTPTSD